MCFACGVAGSERLGFTEMQERCQSFANINEQEQHIMFYPWVGVSHSTRSPQKHPKDKRQWTHSVDAANAACVAQGEVVAELKA